MSERQILTVKCQDQPGIVRAVSEAIYSLGGNIIESAQFLEGQTNTFCLRMEVEFASPNAGLFDQVLREQIIRFDPVITLRRSTTPKRVLLMVSKADHCLRDLLYHWAAGDLPVEIPAVVSNHTDLKELVESYGITFIHLPVTSETKAAQELQLAEYVKTTKADVIVLARYMQILSDGFCSTYPGRIINIHHSFLPGFKGAKPYHQAFERGVKLIGATAHYVTADLDEGPIIEQDVIRVSHQQVADELVKLGRDVERRVLTSALRRHVEDRVMLTGSRTVIFD